MKAFSFRYQTVLDVRDRRLQAEEERLAALLARARDAEAELARLAGQLACELAAWQEAQAEGASLDLQTLLGHRMGVDALDQRMAAMRMVVAETKARADNQREILVEAMREKEIMAKLKERDLAAWRKGVDEAENALIDELATTRHARRNSPSN